MRPRPTCGYADRLAALLAAAASPYVEIMVTPERTPSRFVSFLVYLGAAVAFAACGSSTGAMTGSRDGGDASTDGSILHMADSGKLGGHNGEGGVCTPVSCKQLGVNCGPQGNGCGGSMNCGLCTAPESCGGGGKPSTCGGNMGCTPTTCAAEKVNCGPIGDGCGGALQCGTCSGGEQCGVGGKPGVCGTPKVAADAANPCVPKTCAELKISCGPAGDGCGGALDCGGCDGGSCGGGGKASQCGSGGSICTPKTCAELGAGCGIQADGCGGTITCGGDGGTCPASQTCGGGGTLNQCGTPTGCTPKTCAELNIGCGPAGDGCGNMLTCGGDGGTCPPGETCGAVTPSQCGTPTGCTPLAACPAGACGPIGDGCGGMLSCGVDGGLCPPGQTCGGGGVPSQCGSGGSMCKSQTCAQLGFNCGLADDGCGNVINCGGGGAGFDAGADAGAGCTPPQICGGGGLPNVCGPTGCTTALCMQQVACDGSATTTVMGTVLAPNGGDPIYNATVYVPNGTVEPFTTGVVCGCDPLTGDPLVQTTSALNGTFVLTNVPCGTNIPLVIQLGRWRRQVVIPNVTCCGTTNLDITNPCNFASAAAATTSTGCLTSMPTTRAQGDIPLTAVVTGSADAMECVLLKMGIDISEWGDPGPAATNPNRIQIYQGDYGGGATFDANTPSEDTLWNQAPGGGAVGADGITNLENYDLVVFSCQGPPPSSTVRSDDGMVQQYLIDYTNVGGRAFLSHYNYIWLWNDAPFSGTADWDVNQSHTEFTDPTTGYINMSFPRGAAMANWLQLLYPTDTLGEITINTLRKDFDNVVAPTLLWMTAVEPGGTLTAGTPPVGGQIPEQMTFDTPVGSTGAATCGRVEFEDYHVENTQGVNPANDTYFITDVPTNECGDWGGSAANLTMTQQEKMLEFQLFDLTSCITAQTTCIPQTCATAGPHGTPLNCGLQGDGCGNIINCGGCDGGTCGGGGTPGICGASTCVPSNCGAQGIECGPAGDGCGNPLDCGGCDGGTCGGGGPSKCGTGGCTPLTCAAQGIGCGPSGDGCGNALDCGGCDGGTCGGGGTPNMCGSNGCTPTTCKALGFTCGPASNGCGGEIASCGMCTPPQICGGGGSPSVCGGSNGCVAETCLSQGFNCGPAGDGCGNELQCGTCQAGQACGAGGMPGVCAPLDGSACNPISCATQGFNCGPAGNGCGGEIQCGTCPSGEACGAGGNPGKCGPTGCAPQTCAAQNINCGPAGDGCGGTIQCGTCTAPATCGGGGTPGQCGSSMGAK